MDQKIISVHAVYLCSHTPRAGALPPDFQAYLHDRHQSGNLCHSDKHRFAMNHPVPDQSSEAQNQNEISHSTDCGISFACRYLLAYHKQFRIVILLDKKTKP
jgi:hypothetical protein